MDCGMVLKKLLIKIVDYGYIYCVDFLVFNYLGCLLVWDVEVGNR